jgi:hypothetical protein
MNDRAAIHQWISAAGKSDEGLRAGDTRMKNDTAGLQRERRERERYAAAAAAVAQVTRGILSLHGLRAFQ